MLDSFMYIDVIIQRNYDIIISLRARSKQFAGFF